MTEEVLILALFYREISKQLHSERLVPGRIKRIRAHFDLNMNANAEFWNWDRIKAEVKGLVEEFWKVGKDY